MDVNTFVNTRRNHGWCGSPPFIFNGSRTCLNSSSSSSPMSSAIKALEILSSRAFFMASVLGTVGYSYAAPVKEI